MMVIDVVSPVALCLLGFQTLLSSAVVASNPVLWIDLNYPSQCFFL